jgi:hypothetical protein
LKGLFKRKISKNEPDSVLKSIQQSQKVGNNVDEDVMLFKLYVPLLFDCHFPYFSFLTVFQLLPSFLSGNTLAVITDGGQIGQKAMMKDGESGMPGKFQKFFIRWEQVAEWRKRYLENNVRKKEKCVLPNLQRKFS